MNRIRILFFIEELRAGGAEKVLCNLVNEMDQSEFDITVQTLWKAEATQFLKPGIRYRSCYAKKNRINRYLNRIETAARLTYPLHIRDSYDVEVAYLEFGSTKIISHSSNRQAKKIAWVHSDLAEKLLRKPETIQKLAKQYAAYDRIVCVSQTARNSFVQLFGRERDTVVLYNTVDDEAIRQKAELLLPNFSEKKHLTVVSVGRLSPEKQYDMLLRVHKRILEEGVYHELRIVGEGPERPRLESMIKAQKLAASVLLCGYQANPYPYMKAADLLVCSSRYEGLSTFVTEGLILGKPIVTTECSGMRELLGDSEYGLVVANSEAALLDGMRCLLTDPSLRKEYSVKAADCGKRFSAIELSRSTEEFFKKLIEE